MIKLWLQALFSNTFQRDNFAATLLNLGFFSETVVSLSLCAADKSFCAAFFTLRVQAKKWKGCKGGALALYRLAVRHINLSQNLFHPSKTVVLP